MQDKEQKFFCEIDDFGMLLPGMDSLLRLKKHWPDFKMTCFTIPMPKEFFLKENQKHFTNEKYKDWAKIVNSYDWMEIGLHGFSHTHHEFDINYDEAITMLNAIENMWKEIGLKYKKIFRAPYWQYSYDALCALRDKGYVVAIDRNNPRPVPEGLKTYVYNWSFEELLPKTRDGIIKGHGHINDTAGVNNGLGMCYNNIIRQIPEGAKFGFTSELVAAPEVKN